MTSGARRKSNGRDHVKKPNEEGMKMFKQMYRLHPVIKAVLTILLGLIAIPLSPLILFYLCGKAVMLALGWDD